MDTINYAVCDDEEIILEAVYDRVSTIFKRSGISARGIKFQSSVALRTYIGKQTSRDELNLVFLDINMPELNGIELGKVIKEKAPKTEIVFVSNRYEKVFDTFDIHPFGFVRKNNFSTDISKTLKAFITARGKDDNYFVIQQENNSVTKKLLLTDIVYIESLKNHQYIHMINGETVDVRMTMDELEKRLSEHDILRAHKGTSNISRASSRPASSLPRAPWCWSADARSARSKQNCSNTCAKRALWCSTESINNKKALLSATLSGS